PSFDWSGKEVEVQLPVSLKKDQTYVVTIGNELKDVRGSNRLEVPYTFAFSTGNIIDSGKISGKVFAENFERIKILAFQISGKSEAMSDPSKNSADYVSQISPDGNYVFTNLSKGEYRLFAVRDEDRNNLYDKAVDKISVLSGDIVLDRDSTEVDNANFLLRSIEADRSGKDFLKQLKADSINFISSNISNNEKNIPDNYKLYFYFKNLEAITKEDVVNNFFIIDSSLNKSYRLVFNWINDSLLEVFSTENYKAGSVINVLLDLSTTDKKYRYSRNFEISGSENSARISGRIISKETLLPPVNLKLIKKDNSFISYSKRLVDSVDFVFENIPEGDYLLFSYVDQNENGKFDEGNFFPFTPSEKFVIYENNLRIKGSWKIENVFLEY
ncbi:MAG: Ig-like domain-containing protein, partial [Ignavibacteria bacterium]